MRSIEDLSRRELAVFLNKCWMTHDGMWFFHCFQELGIDTTNRLNRAAIKSLAPIEIKRIINILDVDAGEIKSISALRDFFKATTDLVIPDFMGVKWHFLENNIIRWKFDKEKCFAYKGIGMMGAIDRYQCGVLYRIKCWIEELGIRHQFKPEIAGCLMHLASFCFTIAYR